MPRRRHRQSPAGAGSMPRRPALLTGVLLAAWSAPAAGQAVRFDFDGTPDGLCGGRKVAAKLGEGARFVESAEGRGVEPGAAGPAAIVPVPDALWKAKGTLAFRFRPSRTIRLSRAPDGKTLSVPLMTCPVLDLTLGERKGHAQLILELHTAEKRTPWTRILLSHLAGERWYHLAVAWDAKSGRVELYLNGTLQQWAVPGFNKPAPWKPPQRLSGELRLGGRLGEGSAAARIAVDAVRLWGEFLDEAAVRRALAGRHVAPLRGEGRTVYDGRIDLKPYKLELVYEADFGKPLRVVGEDDLFDADKRSRRPKGFDWVLEGPGRAWTRDGKLHIDSARPRKGGHVVLWNTRTFPADFLLEFGLCPKDSLMGLNIVFFCATSRAGGDIFAAEMPRRGGVFRNYHSGALNAYHASYWACATTGVPRRTANLRKNHGFFLPACGVDRIAGRGPGPHKVRLLKVGGKIRLETCGKLALAWDDDGKTYGPVLGAGRIGLRQMGHTHRAAYTHFKVWHVEER